MTAVVQIGGTLADTKPLRRQLNVNLDHNYKGSQWYKSDDHVFTILPEDRAPAAACICRLVYKLYCTEILFIKMDRKGRNKCASRLLDSDSGTYYPDMQFHSIEYEDFYADSLLLETVDYVYSSFQWTFASGDTNFLADIAIRLHKNQENT